MPTARSGGPTPPLVRVPEATDGKPDVLEAVIREHALVAVVEAPVVRSAAAVLRRTPEVCALAGAEVKATAIAAARWQHEKP